MPRRRRNMPIGRMIALDVLGLAVALGIFWLFHIKISSDVEQPVSLPTHAAAATVQPSVPAASGGAQTSPSGSTSPQASANASSGDWGAKFAGKFTDGDVEKTADSYRSKDISVKLQKMQKPNLTYYVADIYIRNLENFKTAFGKDNPGSTDTTVNMAKNNDAIIAISGDYFSAHPNGIVIRNGKLYRESKFQDVLVMNNDGSMQTFTTDRFDIDKVKQDGAWQAWSFGPMLLDNGQPMEKFNSSVNVANPRSAIGYYEPGHYCFVLVDGRQEGYSSGMTMKDLSKLFHDLGCKAAYNLDGGQTAVMAFMGNLANKPYNGGRKVSDIIYIAEKQ